MSLVNVSSVAKLDDDKVPDNYLFQIRACSVVWIRPDQRVTRHQRQPQQR